MINEEYKAMLGGKSVIRELSEYATSRGAEIGYQNVFDYSLGNPSVPAPKSFTDAMVDLYENGDPVAIHGYSPSLGIPSVKDAIAENLNERFGMAYTGNHIFPTTGAAGALSHAMRAVTKPGDEIIVIAPYFPEYRIWIEFAGGVCVEVPAREDNFQIDLDALEQAITEKTKAVVINTPNNPVGTVYTRETLEGLADVLVQAEQRFGHDIYLISDEPYRELTYGVEVPWVPAIYPNTLVCYSWSKSLSLPGDRIGYVLVPNEVHDSREVYLAVCGAGRSLGYICAPVFFQRVIERCVDEPTNVEAYAVNREILTHALDELGYEYIEPDGAFYLWIKALEPDAQAFSNKAKEHELLLVPSDSFGVDGWVRAGYCIDKSTIEHSIPAFAALKADYE